MKFFLGNFLFCNLFAWFCCLASFDSSAQVTSLDSPVSFTVSDQPLAVALDLLSVNCGITFSYNPDQLDADKMVTVQFAGIPLREVLQSMLPPDIWGYKLSGNQVILYRLKSPEQDADREEYNVQADNDWPGQLKTTDTIYLTRTQFINDTILRTDTIVRYDTVLVIPAVIPDTSVIPDDNLPGKTSLPEELTKSFSFEAGISLTWLAASSQFTADASYDDLLQSYRETTSGSLLSGSINLNLRVKYARFSLETGVSYTGFSEKFVYNYMEKNGGYYRKDTLDIYYTLSEGDTSWYYVLDSTYLPLDQKDYKYNSGTHYNYIDVPLALQYNQPAGRLLVYGRAGIIASISAGNSGWYILAGEDGVGDVRDLEPRVMVISWMIGAGIMMPLNDEFTFSAGAIYRKQLQDIYKDFPVGQRFGAFGINAGIIYKL